MTDAPDIKSVRPALIAAAQSVCGRFSLREDFSAGAVGAAILTACGNIYTGICIDLACGLGFCAEVAAIAEMLKARETHVRAVVAISADGKLLPPCGRCRETIAQLDPRNLDCLVVLPDEREVPLRALLPDHWLEEPSTAAQGFSAEEPTDSIRLFLEELVRWAAEQPDIQAIALVGSHARKAATATSDIDLVIIARQPEQYLQHTDWIHRFGPVRRQQAEDYGRLVSLRVWYDDGREVEYGLTDERWAAQPLDAGTQQVIAGGMRVLFERTPLLSALLPVC